LKLWWLRPCRESREKQLAVVRFGSKADMCSAQADVRFVPIADIPPFFEP
jgi:hypothetical protein